MKVRRTCTGLKVRRAYFYRLYVETQGTYAQRGRAVPVCGVETMHYLQVWDADDTSALSTPLIRVEPFYPDLFRCL